jgi:glycosyltransferase involved in cell wall biosynthesis
MAVPSAARRRLLFAITTSDFGGTESFLLRLLAGIDRDRFDCRVCSLCPPGRVARRIEELGIPVSTLDMASRPLPHQLLAGVVRLRRLLRAERIELVHSLLYRANVLAALATRGAGGARLVMGQRSLIPAGRGRDAWAQRLTRRWAAKVVAVSEAVRAELLATEQLPPERVVVIPNGIDLATFDVGDADAEARQRAACRRAWAIPEDALVVGAVGRLHGPKGIEHLLAAAESAAARAPELGLHLVLAGDGPELERLRARAATLQIAARVHFLGFEADPRRLYPGFDVYALPSLAEGSPNALLEAMACRRACVASAVGGVPEALRHGREGLLVPPADAAALTVAILELARRPQLRRELAAAARARVAAEFDLRRMVGRHEALYAELLAGADQGFAAADSG